jgi:Zn-dependent protease with chaperone function
VAITHAGSTFLGFQEYIEGQSSRASPDGAPSYAHPIDQWIQIALNATPVKAMIDKTLDVIVDYQQGLTLAENPLIDDQSYPEVYAILSGCADTLHIPMPQLVLKRGAANAAASSTGETAVIQVHQPVLDFFNEAQICWVLGHECGHIAAQHTSLLWVLQVLTQLTQFSEEASALTKLIGFFSTLGLPVALAPLMAWSRRAEVTADRAALLCGGDLKAAEEALVRLQTNSFRVERIDVEDYLRRHRAMSAYYKMGQMRELFRSHPIAPKRIAALRLFARSELYYTLSGKEPPAHERLLNQEELDRQVSQVIKP